MTSPSSELNLQSFTLDGMLLGQPFDARFEEPHKDLPVLTIRVKFPEVDQGGGLYSAQPVLEWLQDLVNATDPGEQVPFDPRAPMLDANHRVLEVDGHALAQRVQAAQAVQVPAPAPVPPQLPPPAAPAASVPAPTNPATPAAPEEKKSGRGGRGGGRKKKDEAANPPPPEPVVIQAPPMAQVPAAVPSTPVPPQAAPSFGGLPGQTKPPVSMTDPRWAQNYQELAAGVQAGVAQGVLIPPTVAPGFPAMPASMMQPPPGFGPPVATVGQQQPQAPAIEPEVLPRQAPAPQGQAFVPPAAPAQGIPLMGGPGQQALFADVGAPPQPNQQSLFTPVAVGGTWDNRKICSVMPDGPGRWTMVLQDGSAVTIDAQCNVLHTTNAGQQPAVAGAPPQAEHDPLTMAIAASNLLDRPIRDLVSFLRQQGYTPRQILEWGDRRPAVNCLVGVQDPKGRVLSTLIAAGVPQAELS